MKQKEFDEKITGIVEILIASDIIQRCMKLAEKGKRKYEEGSDWSHTHYEYFFKTKDEKQWLHISTGEAYHWGSQRQIDILYNHERVLDAVQCEEKDIPKNGIYSFETNSSDSKNLYIFVKQSDNNDYKIRFYKKGEWEELVNKIEQGLIQEFKEPKKTVVEPEVDEKIVEQLNYCFNI